MAVTPIRNLRVDDERWARWQQVAEGLGVSVTELIREAVDDRVDRAVAPPLAGVVKGAGYSPVPTQMVVALPASAAMGADVLAKPARSSRPRSGMCPHRLPPSSYCAVCDK